MPDSNERESIWTVAPRTKKFYFLAFFVLFIIGMSVVAANESLEGVRGAESPLNVLVTILSHAGSLAIGSATISMIAAEAGSFTMVLTEKWLERIREQRRAEGRAEARKVIQRALAKARESGDASRIEAYEELLLTFDVNDNLPSNHK